MTVTEPGLRAGGSAERAGSAARSRTRHGVTKRLCKQNLNIIGSIIIRRRRFILRILHGRRVDPSCMRRDVPPNNTTPAVTYPRFARDIWLLLQVAYQLQQTTVRR